MKRTVIVMTVLLCACAPQPSDTVDSLVADPVRLKELRKQCRLDHEKIGDATCNAVAEATRRRFMGDVEKKAPK